MTFILILLYFIICLLKQDPTSWSYLQRADVHLIKLRFYSSSQNQKNNYKSLNISENQSNKSSKILQKILKNQMWLFPKSLEIVSVIRIKLDSANDFKKVEIINDYKRFRKWTILFWHLFLTSDRQKEGAGQETSETISWLHNFSTSGELRTSATFSQ